MQKKHRNQRRLSWIETGAGWLLSGGCNWAGGNKRSPLIEDVTDEAERDYLSAYWGIHSERLIAERAEKHLEQCLPVGSYLFDMGLVWADACRRFDVDTEEAEFQRLDAEERAIDAELAELEKIWKIEDAKKLKTKLKE